MITTKLQRHLARQALYRAARSILGAGNGDHSHWSRAYMFEDDLGMPSDWTHDAAAPPAAACMLGWIEVHAKDVLVRDEARNMLDAYIRRDGGRRGYGQFLFTGRAIPIYNDEIAGDVAEASDALKQAALTG